MIEKKMMSHGTKAYQRDDREDRFQSYNDFHRTLHPSLLMTDCDSLEYRIINHDVIPVALVEVTRNDDDRLVGREYLKAILDRFGRRDTQGKAIRKLAEMAGLPIFLVLFQQELTKLWVFNISKNQGWYLVDRDEYERWLLSLPDSKIRPEMKTMMTI